MPISPGRTIAIISLAACLLIITSCSRRAYNSVTYSNIEGPAERKQLDEFISRGVEKPLDIRSITPEQVIGTARGYLGVPHCMGGKSMKCIDCSGLVAVAFSTHGIQLPHNSEEQARYGKIITDREELMPGDLVFFIRTYSTSRFITHSGIYIGDNKFLHTSTSLGVTITSLDDPWWNERYLFCTRVFHQSR